MIRRFETGGAPYFPPTSTVRGVMLQVIYALLPGIAAHVWFFGPGILVQLMLACGFAVLFEAASLAAAPSGSGEWCPSKWPGRSIRRSWLRRRRNWQPGSPRCTVE